MWRGAGTVHWIQLSHDLGQDDDWEDWGLWPMVTPILGDISDECKAASTEYIRLLNESFHSPDSSEEHKNALRRFDSSAPLPFLLDGILLDVSYVDLCDILDNDKKKCPLPDEFRYLGIPYSNGAAPGLEHVCKNLESSKYCHNYIYTYGSEEWSKASGVQIGYSEELMLLRNQMPSFSWQPMNMTKLDLLPPAALPRIRVLGDWLL